MTKTPLRSIEQRLEQELFELGAVLQRTQDVMVPRSPERGDEAQAEVIESRGVDLNNMIRRHERQVLDALERLRLGAFGVCESCGEPIPRKRLTALPWAALCVGCQEREEAEGWDRAA